MTAGVDLQAVRGEAITIGLRTVLRTYGHVGDDTVLDELRVQAEATRAAQVGVDQLAAMARRLGHSADEIERALGVELVARS